MWTIIWKNFRLIAQKLSPVGPKNEGIFAKFADLNLWAIDLKFLRLYCIWTTICKNFILIAQKFCPVGPKNKRIFAKFANLNFWVLDLKFLEIVFNYINNNLRKFQIDSSKIEACGSHETKELLRNFLISVCELLIWHFWRL